MTILRLRLLSNGEYRIMVHIDTTRLNAEGQPDPRYVFRMEWPPKPPELTHAAYLLGERPKIRARCLTELERLDALEGPPLAGEGDPL